LALAAHDRRAAIHITLKVFRFDMTMLFRLFRANRMSMLAWPVWYRILAVLPVCILLCLGVIWALSKDIG
jgi:hypothetical protein